MPKAVSWKANSLECLGLADAVGTFITNRASGDVFFAADSASVGVDYHVWRREKRSGEGFRVCNAR